MPNFKDPDRVPDPSTLRRWFRNLDSSRPAFSFLRPALQLMGRWLTRSEPVECGSLRLPWRILFPFLQVFWPVRLESNEIFLLTHRPCLETGGPKSVVWARHNEVHRGRGFGATQTAHSIAGVLATASLDRTPLGWRGLIHRCVSRVCDLF